MISYIILSNTNNKKTENLYDENKTGTGYHKSNLY